MSRRLFYGVVVLLIALIGAGPACACAARGLMPAAAAPAAAPIAAEHACCHSPKGQDKAANSPRDESCPYCQAMTVSVKAVPDQQSAPAWASLHLLALAPTALLDVPAIGTIHGAAFSPVWSPPVLLDDLFHTFCLLTL
jgi:hypothetical protein